MNQNRVKAIKILQDAFREGVTNRYLQENVAGYEDVSCPNQSAFISALAKSQSKTYDEIAKQLIQAFYSKGDTISFWDYPSEYTLNLTLEEIAQIISEHNILLNEEILEIILHRMFQGSPDLQSAVYDEKGRQRVFFNTKHSEKLDRCETINLGEETRYETLGFLGEAFAEQEIPADDIPQIALDDPRFIYSYITTTTIYRTEEIDGESCEVPIYENSGSLTPDGISTAITFVKSAQAELDSKKNNTTIILPAQALDSAMESQELTTADVGKAIHTAQEVGNPNKEEGTR